MSKYANQPNFDPSLAAEAVARREAAAAAEKEKEDSFERCDTDGFLSQWASGLTASKERNAAEILENGGLAEFIGLYDGDRRVIAKTISTQYGSCWLLDESEIAKFGRKFIPIGKNSRIQKKLGLSERWETQRAGSGYDGKGTGLSGTCYVVTYRRGDAWGREASLFVETEEGDNS